MNLLHGPAPSIEATAAFCAIVFGVAVAGMMAVPAAARHSHSAAKLPVDADTVARWRRRVPVLLIAWLAVTSIAASSGLLARFDLFPPPVMPFLLLTVVMTTLLAFSRFGAFLARNLPLAALVGFHAFRLPLELVLDRLSYDGVLPPQMTFHGMNYDIVTGVTAIPLAIWAAIATPPRFVLLAWNILGFVLLLVIVTIAMLSTPVPFRVFMNEPANTIITTSPWIWLPTVLVQAAWIGHLLLFRR